MALHDPPLEIPFLDEDGFVTKPWAEWLIINKRDKIDRVETAEENEVPIFTEVGQLQSSEKIMLSPPMMFSVQDNGGGTITISITDSHPHIKLDQLTATKSGTSLTIDFEVIDTYIIY